MRASLHILAAALVVLLHTGLLHTGARAQEANPLVQRSISVEATAESAVQARERAHAQARRTALGRLAAELGASAPAVSDATLEGWTSAIIVEEERTSATRYVGRLTVRLSPAAASAMGRSVSGPAPIPGLPTQSEAPAIAQVTASASFNGLGEWRDLRSRLRSSGQVATMELVSIRTDGAVMRLNLRALPEQAMQGLMATGVAVDAAPGADWRIGLAGGG